MDYRARDFVHKLIQQDMLIVDEFQEESIIDVLSKVFNLVEIKAVEQHEELKKLTIFARKGDVVVEKFSSCTYGNDACPKCK